MLKMSNFNGHLVMFLLSVMCIMETMGHSVGGHPQLHPEVTRGIGLQPNPGATMHLTNKMLHHLNEVGIRAAMEALSKLVIPEVSRNLPDEKGYITVQNVKFVELQRPHSSYFVLSPPDEISWFMGGLDTRIRTDIFGRYRFFIPLKIRGELEIQIKNMKIAVTNRFSRNSRGQPIILNTNCSASVRQIKLINYNGGWVGLGLNRFQNRVIGQTRSMMGQEICAVLRSLINVEGNRYLQSMPVEFAVTTVAETFVEQVMEPRDGDQQADVTISLFDIKEQPIIQLTAAEDAEGLKMDFKLTGNAVYNNFILTEHQGEVSWNGLGSTPFHPMIFPAVSPVTLNKSEKMLYMHVSDYVPNSFLYHAFMNQMLQFRVFEHNQQFGKYLRTTCGILDMCLGNFVLSLGEKYPNAQIVLAFTPTKAPALIFRANGTIGVYMEGTVYVFVRPKGQQRRIHLLSMSLLSESTIPTISITDQKIYGQMSLNKFKAEIQQNNLPDLDKGLLDELVDMAGAVVEESVNDLLKKGLPLPIIRGLKLTESKVTIKNRHMLLESDVELDENTISNVAFSAFTQTFQSLQYFF